MWTVTCKRCGRENEVNEYVPELHKCPQCIDIKFDRGYFVRIERRIIQNFKKARTSKFGSILKSLYVFGSYAKKEPKCGDIDFLVTYSDPKLKKFTRSEIVTFQSQFDFFVLEDYSPSELRSIIKESSWDFRICREYPECLVCSQESGNFSCKLPSEDYHSGFHTYCSERCRNKNRNPIPSCCFGYCPFDRLEDEVRGQILVKLDDILKEGIVEFRDTRSGLKIKVLDLIMKRRMKQLEEEFKHKKKMDLRLYRINPMNGKKARVR